LVAKEPPILSHNHATNNPTITMAVSIEDRESRIGAGIELLAGPECP
jgi:hypothetical protein